MQKQALSKEEKILGGFLGAAAGDAMGAATETRSIDDIREKFGGYVKTFTFQKAFRLHPLAS